MANSKTIGTRDVLIAVAIIGLLAAVAALLVPTPAGRSLSSRHSALRGCKSNIKNCATALEMYATDNQGHFPKRLSQLTPNYLKVLPQCPAAQSDTYSPSYRVSEKPDAYTLCCSGQHHVAEGISSANYPQYSSYSGLLLP